MLDYSLKVIGILNRYGHCASYHTVEELETELTFTATKDKSPVPYGMEVGNENKAIGVGFDNYDRFVETLSGKDTLHNTLHTR